jgi:hypothetical protein
MVTTRFLSRVSKLHYQPRNATSHRSTSLCCSGGFSLLTWAYFGLVFYFPTEASLWHYNTWEVEELAGGSGTRYVAVPFSSLLKRFKPDKLEPVKIQLNRPVISYNKSTKYEQPIGWRLVHFFNYLQACFQINYWC